MVRLITWRLEAELGEIWLDPVETLEKREDVKLKDDDGKVDQDTKLIKRFFVLFLSLLSSYNIVEIIFHYVSLYIGLS